MIGPLDNPFLVHLGNKALRGNLPEAVFVLFQMTFAVITPSLIIMHPFGIRGREKEES